MTPQKSNLSVVILSRSDLNVRLAVESVRRHEPDVPITVVDDGLHPLTWRLLDKLGVRRIVPIERWSEQPDRSFVRLPRTTEFVFARNSNIGLRAAFDSGATAAILMNDDCELQTPGGFQHLWSSVILNQGGESLVSAVFDKAVNPRQQYVPLGSGIIIEPEILMFPCILIPCTTYEEIGPLDERFVGYGEEDRAYCHLVRDSGRELVIDTECYVTHSGRSEYRSKPSWQTLSAVSQGIYDRYYSRS